MQVWEQTGHPIGCAQGQMRHHGHEQSGIEESVRVWPARRQQGPSAATGRCWARCGQRQRRTFPVVGVEYEMESPLKVRKMVVPSVVGCIVAAAIAVVVVVVAAPVAVAVASGDSTVATTQETARASE